MLTGGALDRMCRFLASKFCVAACHTADGQVFRSAIISATILNLHDVQVTLYLEHDWGDKIVKVEILDSEDEVWAVEETSVVFAENQDRVLYGITFRIREG